jgi:NAD+ diphosphatase
VKHCGECGTPLERGPDQSGYPRQFCAACGWTWYDPPTPVTLVLVTLPDGRVIYTRKTSFEPGRWSVVSGFIPRGERAEDAAVREVKEETGLDVELVRFMGTHVYPLRPDQIVIAFHARAVGGTLQAGDDVDEVEAAPPEPQRLRPGSTSWWRVNALLQEPPGLLPHYPPPASS